MLREGINFVKFGGYNSEGSCIGTYVDLRNLGVYFSEDFF